VSSSERADDAIAAAIVVATILAVAVIAWSVARYGVP